MTRSVRSSGFPNVRHDCATHLKMFLNLRATVFQYIMVNNEYSISRQTRQHTSLSALKAQYIANFFDLSSNASFYAKTSVRCTIMCYTVT